VNFEEYLYSKKIDSSAFKNYEGELWESWKKEFEELHPSSFTAQKLYLINPIRRKYQLKAEIPTPKASEKALSESNEVGQPSEAAAVEKTEATKPLSKPPMAKPIVRPKPKMN
jgi:hypothetical protein